jgi:hypothetical protein
VIAFLFEFPQNKGSEMKILPVHPFRFLILVALLWIVIFKFYSAFALTIEGIAVNVYVELERK